MVTDIKTLKASEHDREDVRKKREEWKRFRQKVSCNKLIFIDETCAKTNMTRLYSRAKNGRRCHDHAPDGRWTRASILSAIRVTGETCSVVFDGALKWKIYNAYIEKFLLPTLKAGDIVIMGSLNVHKSKTAQKLITEKVCKYIFLPEYSPNLNPIEKMWSKVKQLLRSMKARMCEELYKSIEKALDCITPRDARGWFKFCGYMKS